MPFTFDEYDPANGNPSLEGILWELRIEMMPQRDSIIRQAGFDPADDPRIGTLTRAWGRHKVGSIIVAPDINFIPGSRFCISRETVY
jgi:hypothetical protein